MKYYTKEWYDLMQRKSYTLCFQMISDKVYSDEEIKAFYDSDLEEEIELERSSYDTPPNYDWVDKFLQTENFDQRMVSFPDENGEVICFDSPQMAKEYFKSRGFTNFVVK